MKYEYIRLKFDFGDLEEMNRLSTSGWRVISVTPDQDRARVNWALLERPLHEIRSNWVDKLIERWTKFEQLLHTE